MSANPIRVLVVDDSSPVRRLLTTALQQSPELQVVGAAESVAAAKSLLATVGADIMTLDMEMPGGSGLDFLKWIMANRPMPVVVVSGATTRAAAITMAALEAGAVEVVTKPATRTELPVMLESLRTVVRAAGRVQGLQARRPAAAAAPAGGAAAANAVAAAPQAAAGRLGAPRGWPGAAPMVARPAAAPTGRPALQAVPLLGRRSAVSLIAIGASTGGTQAIANVLRGLPKDMPPILIVQHLPFGFSKAFVDRLNETCELTVREAKNGDVLQPGLVLVAPSGQQMSVVGSGAALAVRCQTAPAVSGHCPSADVLFDSVARTLGAQAVGVILTGMGADGAAGLLAMRRANAKTLGQDEASCVVYGMPRMAMENGAVERQVSLNDMAGALRLACAR